jgi:NADPH:quinone reductase-like Zn-dependent oxidoreductase
VILDNVGNQPLRRLRRALTPTGTLVSNAGGSPDGHLFGPIAGILRVVVVDVLLRQRLRPLPDTWTREHRLAVTDLIEVGKLTPVLGRTYPLSDSAAGLRHLEEGHARGKVVITVT